MRSVLGSLFRSARPARTSQGRGSTNPRKAFQRLNMEALEAREVPAVAIVLDYSRDLSGFFSNPEARAVMSDVATELGNTLNASLATINNAAYPGNSWTAAFLDPATGGTASVSNLVVDANTIRVYVGGRPLAGTTVGVAAPGTASVPGPAPTAWINTVQTRGHTGFAPWGGSITFDSSETWHFGQTTAGLDAGEFDFYSAATHELAHVLGAGTSAQWSSKVSRGTFVGANAAALYGGPVPLAPDGQHWASNLPLGQAPNLTASIGTGTRVAWSPLDAAALRDLGWGTVPPPATVATAGANVDVVTAGGTTFVLNSLGGVYRQNPDGSYTAIGSNITHISSGQGAFFALRSDGAVFRYNTGTGSLELVVAYGMTQISSGQGEFFLLRNDGAVFQYSGGGFVQLISNGITHISSGQGEFFVLRNDGAVFRYNAGGFVQAISNGITEISSGSGEFFVLRNDGAVFRYNAGGFVQMVSNGITQIGSGQARFFIRRNDGALFQYSEGGFVQLVTSGIVQISSAQGQLFLLRNDSTLFRYNAAVTFEQLAVGVTDIAAGSGQFFIRRNDGAVFRYNSAGGFSLSLLDVSSQISSGSGQFFIRRNDGMVFRFNSNTGGYDFLASNIAQLGSGQGFALRSDGAVLRYNSSTGGYAVLISSGVTQLVSGQGLTFARRSDGAVLRYNISTGNFDVVVASGAAEVVLGQDQVFYRSTGSAVYRYNSSTGGFDLSYGSDIGDIWFSQGQLYVRRTSDGAVLRYEATGYVVVV